MDTNELPDFLRDHAITDRKSDPIWLGMGLSIKRNIARFPFPERASVAEKTQLFALIEKSVYDNHIFRKPHTLSFASLSQKASAFVLEHFLIRSPRESFTEGEGAIIDEESGFALFINTSDHLICKCITSPHRATQDRIHLFELEQQLGKYIPFAFTEQFGYLTSAIDECGTAMLAQIALHLPVLLEIEAQSIDTGVEEERTSVAEQRAGDIVVVQNKYTLGVSEEQIIHALVAQGAELKQKEEALRSDFLQTHKAAFKDRLGRAFGLLKHSYTLDTEETLKALSTLKLGISLGLVSGITHAALDELFLRCRRAHLTLTDPESSSKGLEQTRADFIHNALQPLQLHL